MRFAVPRRPSLQTAAMLIALLASSCAQKPKLGMEAPGRPALTWGSPNGGASAAPQAHVDDTERQLLEEKQEAENKGTDDLALAATLYNLAILRRQQGQLAEAEQLYRRSLEIRERLEGSKHPDVAITLNNLAALRAAAGDYGAAQAMLERALNIRRTALGATHPLTAQSMSNLALLYAAEGKGDAAEPLYRQALSILEKSDGAEQDLGRVLDNYAALLRDVGRVADAEKIEARARGIGAAGVTR